MNDLELAKSGNKEAFARLIESIKVKLYKTGMSILKNDDDTCDAIQETLMSIFKNLYTLNQLEYFQTWAVRIMINKCYDIIRKNKQISNLNEKAGFELDTYYEEYANLSEMEKILNQIDVSLKTVVVLYYYDELSVSEIAESLQIPPGTVKSRLSRAREKLYEIIKKEEGE